MKSDPTKCDCDICDHFYPRQRRALERRIKEEQEKKVYLSIYFFLIGINIGTAIGVYFL